MLLISRKVVSDKPGTVHTAWMQHFMKSPNKLLSGIPIEQIQNPQGLASVLQLVEGLRAKL
jgi:hypothetical protein